MNTVRVESRAADAPRAPSVWLESVSLVLAAALTVVTPLHPTEASYDAGSEATISLAWIVVALLAATSSLAASLQKQKQKQKQEPSGRGRRRPEAGERDALGGRTVFPWRDPLVLLVGACIAWVVLSGLAVGAAGNFRSVLNAVWQWVGYAVSFAVMLWLARDMRNAHVLLIVALSAAVTSSLYGLYEWKWVHPDLVRQYEQDPVRVLQQAGIDAPEGSPQRRQFEDRLRSTEPYSTFGLPNSLAGLLATWLVFASGLAVSRMHRPARNAACVAGLILAALAMLGCLLLTKSRTAWLATLVGIGGMALSQLRLGSRRWITAGAVAAVAVVACGTIWLMRVDPLVIAEAPLSVRYRFEYWAGSLRLAADHIWAGCGVGNFQAFYPQYMQPWSSETVADPHNFFFELIANSGWPAGLMAVAAVLLALRRGIRTTVPVEEGSLAAGDGKRLVQIGCGLAVALAGLPFYSLLQLQAPDLVLLGLLLVVGAGTVWLANAGLAAGVIPVSVIGWSLVTWLINASAAGAIGIWGVSHGMWLLAAVWAARSTTASPKVAAGGVGQGVPWRAGAVLAGLAVVLVAVWQTEVAPVTRSHMLAAHAAGAYDERDAERAWENAAVADRYWSVPWERLAVIRLGTYLTHPSERNWRNFESAVAEATNRNRHSAPLFQQIGDWYLVAYEGSGSSAKRGGSAMIRAYRSAVQLHPANAFYHAQLAWAYHIAGDEERAATEARTALRLDGLVPHEELRLANRKLFEGRERPTVSAERRMRELRNRRESS